MTNTNHAGAPAGSASDVTIQEPPSLRKSLKNRHIQLIALGGAIGTGLFYGSSESISLAGPAILLAYLIGGIAIFMIVRALSEMSVEDPKAGAFSYYATPLPGPSARGSSPAGTTGSTTSSSRWWSCPWSARSSTTGSRTFRSGRRPRSSWWSSPPPT